MKYTPSRFFKYLFALSVLIFCFVFFLIIPVRAQTNEETEVPVLQRTGSRYFRCYGIKNAVYDAETFKKLAAEKSCSNLNSLLKVDFEKQTLIGFRVGGDCFLRVAAKVFRSDKAKNYTVRIKNIWGRCRAGGSFQGWLVIEKIPSDYKVDFKVDLVDTLVDGNREISGDGEFSILDLLKAQNTEILETRPINLKGCIQTIFNKQFVIKDEAAYLKTIRSDASRDWCLKNLEKIDFAKHTLLGIGINSGYCRIPDGLEYKTVKDAGKKQYLLDISYIDPRGSVCRALSQYDLWVLVPKLPEDYEVKFEVKAKLFEEEK